MEHSMLTYFSQHVPSVSAKSAHAVLELSKEGATVPFIARYRKEKTGNLDEVQIRAVIDAAAVYEEVVKRKTFLIKEIGDQNNLTEEIKKRIDVSWDLGELEEIYRPFKKKKKTKATIAREAGLEPLAQWLWDVGHGVIQDSTTMEVKAKSFIQPTAKIVTYEEALKGAQDILIEKISNDVALRALVAKSYLEKGKVISKASKGYKPNSKFEMYKEFEEPVKNLLDPKSTHRYLAMRRGWEEEELSLEIKAMNEDELVKSYIRFSTTQPDNAIGALLAECAKTSLNVYTIPSVVNETHRILKEKADEAAIKVFAENVRRLLLSSPYGAKVVLGVDPGIRTGCKIALVDKAGNYISHTVLFVQGDSAEQKAKTLFSEVLKQIQIESIAVGNGTAGRETETFIRKILKSIGSNVPVIMVNEAGASVYSASDVAREEFPNLDITVRGAISIARRLQDPLAELVKIDPKSIGVGQYQHDVNQNQLKKSLEASVESCVNTVGVDLNTASVTLLSFISGIGPSLAKNIVQYRKEKGLYSERNELLKVPKFSAKAFEQAAGFLRINSGKVLLDQTGIHPERYQAVRDMAHDLSVTVTDLIGDGAKKLMNQRTKWAQIVGEYTFNDIVKELEKPGRDPRDPFKVFHFREDIFEVKDLKADMICPGIVTNVTNFGAFVDIGVHQDGLVHISELSHQFIEDPRKVVNTGDQVTVKVLKVDAEKNQISLTMKLESRSVQASAPISEKKDLRVRDQKKDHRPRTDQRVDQRSGQSRGGQPSQDPKRAPQNMGRPAAQPFNNPFAALTGVATKK